jgi:GNAT superfamily N-acetyltransferase
MSRIVRARTEHVGAMVKLMTSSPLLRRYRVTARGATRGLGGALREGDILLAGMEGDEIVGLAWVIPTEALDRAAYLRLLLVAEDRQSQGLGAALLARVEREARRTRCRHVVLLVTKTNRRARTFYERHGYTHLADLPHFVRRGIAESLYLKSWRT